MKKMYIAMPCVLLAIMTTGCSLSQSVGPKEHPNRLQMEGLINAYVSPNGIHDYEGHIIYLGVFNESLREGELVSFELWPLTGLGVGLVGLRFQLLPIEIGVGTLAYNPKPPGDYAKKAPEKTCPKTTEEENPKKADDPPPAESDQ